MKPGSLGPARLILLAGVAIAAAPGMAQADARAVVACRALPPGAERQDCFERTSAELEKEIASDRPKSTEAPAGMTARLRHLSYRDGAPVFELDNGQTWTSLDKRRLTASEDGTDEVEILKTSVGHLLHFNGSYFGLLVVRTQ